jgi:hypothetical protein
MNTEAPTFAFPLRIEGNRTDRLAQRAGVRTVSAYARDPSPWGGRLGRVRR